jgi:UDP-glucose 4-epimerase
MSVYGKQQTPFKEIMEPDPEDIYAVAKTASERVLRILSEVYGFGYTIVRPHNVYGPRQNMADPYRNVIGIFINSLLNQKNYYIYGDGEQKRSFSYIADVAPYIVKVGSLTKYHGEIFNIGPEEAVTINALSDKILKIFFGNAIPEKLRPVYVADRPKEVKFAFCSNQKAQESLNYKAKTSLDKGLREMIDWAKKLGPQKFLYLKSLELVNSSTPKTWENKLLSK